MKINKRRAFGCHLTQILRELREVYHSITGNKVITRNLSFRLLLFMMAVYFVANMRAQHKRAVIEDKNLKSLAAIFNNPALSDESIELVRISAR
jgi:dipeptide/tripeptide permease